MSLAEADSYLKALEAIEKYFFPSKVSNELDENVKSQEAESLDENTTTSKKTENEAAVSTHTQRRLLFSNKCHLDKEAIYALLESDDETEASKVVSTGPGDPDRPCSSTESPSNMCNSENQKGKGIESDDEIEASKIVSSGPGDPDRPCSSTESSPNMCNSKNQNKKISDECVTTFKKPRNVVPVSVRREFPFPKKINQEKQDTYAILDSDSDVEIAEDKPNEYGIAVRPCSVKLTRLDDSKIRSHESADRKVSKSTRSRAYRRKYPCDKCIASFTKRHHLHVHQVNQHKAKSYRHVCEVCNKKFSLLSRLKRHAETHEERSCEFCSQKCSSYSDLRRHIAFDHVTMHKCSVCDHSFPHKRLLRRHMQVHSENRDRIQCPYEDCPRSYLEKKNLDSHLRSFHEAKRFPCTVEGCTFVLSSKQKLVHHIRLHTSKKVLPTFRRWPHNTADIRRRKLRKMEEKRLQQAAVRREYIAVTPWWERSESENDQTFDSDCSLITYLCEKPDSKTKKRRRRRRRRKRKISGAQTTDESGADTLTLGCD